MQVTVKRVITTVMVVGGLVTGYQILSKPQPVATPQSVEETRANAQSFDQKIAVVETARPENGAPAEVRYAGKTTAMQGQLITDSATVAQLAVRAATSYGAKKAQRSMGMKFRGNVIPTVEDFTTAANKFGVAAIRLKPA